jgi:hypothetical protein
MWFYGGMAILTVLCLTFVHPTKCTKEIPFSAGNSTLGVEGTYCAQEQELPSRWDKWVGNK